MDSLLLCNPRMLRSLALLALALAACGGGYQPDSFSTNALYGGHKFEGTRLQHGCLDIALRAQESLDGDPTLDVSLGNRCVSALKVNLGELRIRGLFAQGEPRTLGLYDPNDEIGSALLGGKAAAKERLEIAGAQGARQVCVSVEFITAARSAGPPQETCLEVQAAQGQS